MCDIPFRRSLERKVREAAEGEGGVAGGRGTKGKGYGSARGRGSSVRLPASLFTETAGGYGVAASWSTRSRTQKGEG